MNPKKPKRKFRTRIKEFRARKGYSQEDLARLVDVTRETISYIERGNYNTSILLAHSIAKALSSSIDELFIFEDE